MPDSTDPMLHNSIGANGPCFTGTVPVLEVLSPVPINSIVCPRFPRLWEYLVRIYFIRLS